MGRSYFYILLLILLGSCSKDLMTLRVTVPAPVFLSNEVQRIGIIDRSIPSEKNQTLDILDRVLSAEGKDFDKDATKKTLEGLFDALSKNERFSYIELLSDLELRTAGLGVFPAPLSWEEVQQITEEYDLDAIYSLSFYDTDTKADYQTAPVEINGPLGVKVPAVEHLVNVATRIRMGWRMYDPVARVIVDEYILSDNILVSGRGINPMKAAEAVLGRKEAVLQTSSRLGSVYAERILPYNLRVSRYYFVKGSQNFKMAKRRAQTGNWEGAAELWKEEVDNRKRKIAGRAAYNMAIIHEINGDLNTALDWANRSYSDYRNKEALQYSRILRNRIRDIERLEFQEKN